MPAFEKLKGRKAYLQHVAHEGLGMGASRRVYDEGHHGGKARCKCFGDDGTRGRPSEDLNLPRSVDNNVL